MPDLDTQLRNYFDHVVQRVEADDVLLERIGTDPVRPLQVRSPRRHVPGWVYGVAAAAVVLVVVGGVALLISPANTVAPQGTMAPTPTIAATVPLTTAVSTTTVPERPPVNDVVVPTPPVTLDDVETVVLQSGDGVTFSLPEGCVHLSVKEVDSQGRVWATDRCAGLYRLEGDAWVTLFESTRTGGRSSTILGDVSAPIFREIIEAPDGTIWVAVASDVLTYDGTEWSTTRPWVFSGPPLGGMWEYPAEGTVAEVRDLALDETGNPWVVHGNRLMRWGGETWRQVEDAPTGVERVSPDTQGRLWVATSTGVHQLGSDGWISFAFPEPSLAPRGWMVSDLVTTTDGETVWVALTTQEPETTAFWSLTGGAWTAYEFGSIGHLGVLPDGSVWATSREGAFMFDGTSWTRYVMPDSTIAGLTDDGVLWYEPEFQLVRYQLTDK